MDLSATSELIRATYLADARPWVLGFSGGKDSTSALQLVWGALSKLSKTERIKPVYVLSSNTLVESPVIVSYITRSINQINVAAQEANLPITASIVEPLTKDSFWVNLIGRGYPAPYNKFRWCTDRLKISPANRFIRDQVARHGEVVLILGVRKAESSTRAQVMAFHQIKGSSLRSHSTLNGALILAPIEDWSTDDVWAYLLQNATTPWGTDNNDLAAMYRTADGECPLVVDTTTPSCGNSRFGCWVCTVVSRDKSMEAMIDSGQAWMEELLSIRDFLAETQLPDRKKRVRSVKKLDGRILLKYDGDEAALGPYTLDFSKEVLLRVLMAQANLPPEAGEFEIISDAELLAIRKIWRSERFDWADSVPKIFESAFGKKWNAVSGTQQVTNASDELLDNISERFEIPANLLRRLLIAERRAQGHRRRAQLFTDLNGILDEDWRDEDTLLTDIEALQV